MELDPQGPVVVVPVEIGGPRRQAVLDMALDTGATFLMIPPGVAHDLGLEPGSSARHVRVWTASAVERQPVVRLASVSALGIEVRDVEAVCHQLPPGSRVDGLLGLSFLRRMNVDLHFLSRRIHAWKSSPAA